MGSSPFDIKGGMPRFRSHLAPALLLLLLLAALSLPKALHAQKSPPAPLLASSSGDKLKSCGLAGSSAGAAPADYVMVYQSAESMVCVDKTIWSIPEDAAAIRRFFPYLDAVIAYDKRLFHVQTPPKPFLFEITKPSPIAHTGCDLTALNGGHYCNTVGGDTFTRSFQNPKTHEPVPGFWAYLLTLHESINVFSGLLSGGWPSDWWADHRSPFPSAMDIEFMRAIAQSEAPLDPATKSALLAAAQAQEERFTNPSRPRSYDPQVVLYLNLFRDFGGFNGFANSFQYAIGEDHLQWPSVSQVRSFTGDDKHSELLTEYVIAYLHLGFGAEKDLTPLFRAAGVGELDRKIPPYTIDSAKVKAIADAHCSIRAAANAGVKVKKQLHELQVGNFAQAMAEGGTSASCPSECTFTADRCQAKF